MVIVERLARIAAASDTVCAAQKSRILSALWELVTVAALDIQREKAA